MAGPTPCHPILAHLPQVSLPKPLPKELRQVLNLAEAEDLRQSKVDSGRVGFHPKRASYLIQELCVQHKICAFHVYSIHLFDAAVQILAPTRDRDS
jgi:hypothetical protein